MRSAALLSLILLAACPEVPTQSDIQVIVDRSVDRGVDVFIAKLVPRLIEASESLCPSDEDQRVTAEIVLTAMGCGTVYDVPTGITSWDCSGICHAR